MKLYKIEMVKPVENMSCWSQKANTFNKINISLLFKRFLDNVGNENWGRFKLFMCRSWNIIPISDCYRIELLLRFDNNTTTLLNMSRISDEVAVNTSVGLECKSQHRLVSGDLNVTCTSYAGWTGKFPICRRKCSFIG